MDVGGSQAQLAGALFEDDAARVGLLELPGYVGGLVGAPIVDDDDLVVELAGGR
jgi:hypothetical protein